MNQKRKYRHFILFCLVLDLLAVVFLGYRYLDRKIPDEIHIDRNSGLDFSSLSGIPFVSFGGYHYGVGRRKLSAALHAFGENTF